MKTWQELPDVSAPRHVWPARLYCTVLLTEAGGTEPCEVCSGSFSEQLEHQLNPPRAATNFGGWLWFFRHHIPTPLQEFGLLPALGAHDLPDGRHSFHSIP